MKSKITKIRNLFMKGIAIIIVTIISITLVAYASTSLNDNGDFNLSIVDQILYGKVGATAKEIEKYFAEGHTTLYISSETQLRALAEYVNSSHKETPTDICNGDHSCYGKEIILTKNIELSEKEWDPIGKALTTTAITTSENNSTDTSDPVVGPEFNDEGGIVNEELEDNGELNEYVPEEDEDDYNQDINIHTEEDEIIADQLYNSSEEQIVTSTAFEGTFDGNGYTISNLNYSKENKTYDELKYIGLFGITGENATIKNLTTDNFNINLPYEDKDLYLGKWTDIVNSQNTLYSTYYFSTGNIVGYNQGNIENCINNSNIYGAKDVGGIAGDNTGNINNCKNTGIVDGYRGIGGITGRTKNASLKNCYNDANISGNYYIGGISGYLEKVEAENCCNRGNVKGYKGYIGGSFGCILETKISHTNNYGYVTGEQAIGGIIGYAYNSTITNVLNNGETESVIFGSKINIGGIAGVLEKGTLNNAINKMKVHGYKYVGGIVGQAKNSNISYVYTMDNASTTSTANFDVLGVEYVGGLIGYLYQSNLARAGTTAEVLGVQKCIGGAVGCIGVAENNKSAYIGKVAVLGTTRLDVDNWTFSSDKNGVYKNDNNPVVSSLTTNEMCYGTGSIAGQVYCAKGTINISNNYIFGNVIGMKCTGSVVGYIPYVGDSQGVVNITGTIRDARYTYILSKVNTTLEVRQFLISLKGKDENGTNIATSSSSLTCKNKSTGAITTYQLSNATNLGYGLQYTGLMCGYNGNSNPGSSVSKSFYFTNGIGNTYNNKEFNDVYEDNSVNNGIYGVEYVVPESTSSCFYDFKIQSTLGNKDNSVTMPIVNSQDTLENVLIGSTLNADTVGKPATKNAEGTVLDHTVSYKLYKVYKRMSENNTEEQVEKEITSEEFVKIGDKLKVVATIDAPIVNVIDISNNLTQLTTETAPTLSLKKEDNVIATVTPKSISDVTSTSTETVLTYEYEITDETPDQETINKISLNKVGTLYVVDTTAQITDSQFGEAETSDIIIDNKNPDVSTEIYVQQPLETNRYTSGKEILIKVTTDERIYGNYVLPDVRVRFSKSGLGKYIAARDAEVGHAKIKSATINLDGNTEWLYSYIVQEGDEGNVIAEFTSGTIMDRAGNTTYLQDRHVNSDSIDPDNLINQFGDNFNIESIKFYKNQECTEEINLNRYQIGNIYVKVELDDALYVLNNDNIEIAGNTTVPKLYLNNNLQTEVLDVLEGKTIIYKYDNNGSNITLVDYITLKNESDKKLYYGQSTIAEGRGIEPNSMYQKILDDTIYLDPNGIFGNLSGNGIYADTTLPTVDITAYKVDSLPTGDSAVVGEKIENSRTNADIIRYRFKFSEDVIGFTEDDITLNSGNKSSVGLKKVNDRIYDLYVETNVKKENTEEVQVIVEQDTVQDLVYKGNVRREKVITVDKKAPTLEIYADKDLVNKDDEINYTFHWSETVKDFTVDDIVVTNGEIVENSFAGSDSSYTIKVKSTNGNDLEVEVNDNVCTDVAGNDNIGNRHVIGVMPTVEIIARGVENSITNQNEIIYEFKWSETVTGFTPDDITVNNGTKGTLSDAIDNGDGTYSYTMTITTSVENGNTGEVQVIIEKDAACDLAGLGNVRTESVIRVDKQSPILISLESYAKSNVIDSVNNEVSEVKEKYKSGDTVVIVATFSENIEDSEIPTLTLQFSESGKANGVVNPGLKYGNKIIYTYVIDNEDKGILSVAEFTGKVKDPTGNETVVTKRALEGNTVIADSEAPTLVGITAIAPEFKYESLLSNEGETRRYGIGTEIKFIAEFDENVYSYADRTINNMTRETAPDLKFKFGNTERTARFSKVNGKIIEYTYTIGDNDNGELSNVSISGTGTKAIYDIAGNSTTEATAALVEYLGNIKLEANEHIVADTTAPKVSLKVTSAENSEVTGKNNNYKAGTVLTITAKTDEYVYNKSGEALSVMDNDVKNAFSIKFGGVASKATAICTSVDYVLDEDNKPTTVFTYEYTITDGDMGAIELSFANEKYYDIALNKNSSGTTDSSSIRVIADTENPYYLDQPGIEFVNGKYTVEFNEDLYYLDESNTVISFGNVSYAPTLKFENESAEYTPSISGKYINYTGAYVNAKPYLSASRLCDAAGNLYSFFDQTAPTLTKIEVVSPETGEYREGTEVTIVATFDEDIASTTLPTLSLQFSKSGDAKGRVSGEIEGNTVTYTYTINAQDKGVLSIKDFTGTVKDLVGNETILSKKDLEGSRITADSEGPKLTITSDIESEKTNNNKVIYTFAWDEPVKDFAIEDIEVINGSKGTFTPVQTSNGKVYTLEVFTANEGRQIVTVPANKCTDMAGNLNDEVATINSVVIDYTKPEVRAKVNGGNYVVDTDNQTSTLKETLVVNEEISKFEYIWSSANTTPETGWEQLDINNIDINNDIQLSTNINKSNIGENGTSYYLYIRVTDKAGNEATGRTNAFVVRNETITFQANPTETTNSSVTVTVSYGDKGLTENKRAGIQGKTQSADPSTVILSENGKVYAEASDIAGNKVYSVFDISNIDKTTSLEITSITRSTEQPAESVTLTVNAVCDGSEIDGYSIDNGNTWQKSNKFNINANGTYTILVKDKTGNQVSDSIVISNISQTEDKYFRITNYTQKTENNVRYVVGISTYTKVSNFIPYIQTNMTYTIEDREGNVVSNNDLVATNMKITVSNGDEYILVVRGDLNSDGIADISDLGIMARYLVGKGTLSKAYMLAADINSDNEVDISDISLLARAITKNIKL